MQPKKGHRHDIRAPASITSYDDGRDDELSPAMAHKRARDPGIALFLPETCPACHATYLAQQEAIKAGDQAAFEEAIVDGQT